MKNRSMGIAFSEYFDRGFNPFVKPSALPSHKIISSDDARQYIMPIRDELNSIKREIVEEAKMTVKMPTVAIDTPKGVSPTVVGAGLLAIYLMFRGK